MWIDPNKELPKIKQDVLVATPSTIGVTISSYWGDGGPTDGWTNMGVTHWMSLPKFSAESWNTVDTPPKSTRSSLKRVKVLGYHPKIGMITVFYWGESWSLSGITHWIPLPLLP